VTMAAAQDDASRVRAAPRRRPGLMRRIARHWADYLYILPAFAVMLLVIGYPIYDTVYLSFFNTPPSLAMADKTYVGLDNYSRILGSDSFREVTINTLIWTVYSTFFAFILGLGAALALNSAFIGRGMLRGLFLIPYVISAVAASYVWRWLYHSDFGVIGALSVAFGLQTVPDELHRAAKVDGAGIWQRFWHITMPHLKGVTMVTVLLLLVTNLNGFTIPWIMTGGGPAGSSDIWITQIYQLAFGRIRFGIASAYSVILFVVMMGLGYFYVRALTQGERRPE
jgi:multiple sugar transport system permease protein